MPEKKLKRRDEEKFMEQVPEVVGIGGLNAQA